MANPYQRRKIKNPSLKTNGKKNRKNKKNKGFIPNDPVLRQHWNPKLSIAKNYAKLGLAYSVNSIQPKTTTVSPLEPFLLTEKGTTIPLNDLAASFHPGVIVQPAVVKKNEQGEVISYELFNPASNVQKEDLTTTTNSTIPSIEDSSSSSSSSIAPTTSNHSNSEAVKAFQALAHLESTSKSNYMPPKHILGWLDKLRRKHGEDYHAMFRDKQLNIYQYTAAQLKAKIKRCKKIFEIQD